MADRNINPDRSVGSHPIGEPARKRPLWLLALLGLLVLAAIVLLLLLLSRCGGDSSGTSTAATPVSTPAATTTAPSTADVVPATSAPAPATATAGAAGILMAGSETLLPMTDATMVGTNGDLSKYSRTKATATAVMVQSVPADEGFWVGDSDSDRVWVQLIGGTGESPVTVKKGDAVSFTGMVVKNTAGFAGKAGVTDAEGAKLLDAQGQHLVVPRKGLTLSK